VTTHSDEGIVVLSIWHGDRCTASFQLPMADAGRLIGVLASGLSDQLAEERAGLPAHGTTAAAES